MFNVLSVYLCTLRVFGMLRLFLCISSVSHVTNPEYPPPVLWDWLSFHCACQRLTQAWVQSHCKSIDSTRVPALGLAASS